MTAPTIIHIHVPKSAGTTINAVLSATIRGQHFTCAAPEEGEERLRAMQQDLRDRIAFVYGHFAYGLHRLFTQPVNYIASVREPRRRLLSFYRYVLATEDHPKHVLVKHSTHSFSSFLRFATIEPRVQGEIDNLQVRMIAGDMRLRPEYSNVLSLALSNVTADNFLATEVHFLSEFFARLGHLMHLEFGTIPTLNTSEKGTSFEEEMERLGPDDREILEHFVKWDVALHSAVRDANSNDLRETPLPSQVVTAPSLSSLTSNDTSLIVRGDVRSSERLPSLTLPAVSNNCPTRQLVRALYRVLLLREPDPPGFDSYVKAIQNGWPIDAAICQILKSQEFLGKHKQFLRTYVEQARADNITRFRGATRTTNKAAANRKIVFLGDSQAFWLAQFYHEFVAPSTCDEARYVDTTSQVSEGDLTRIGEADIVVSQIFDVERQTTVAHIRPGVPQVEFPAIFIGFLWPFSGQGGHVRNEPKPWLRDGPYPGQIGDKFLNKMITDGVKAEDALTRYLDLDVPRVARLDRLVELHLGAQAMRDEKTEFAFARIVEARLRETQLFLTSSHPTLALWIPLIKGVFERLGVPAPLIETAVQAQRVPPFSKLVLPIHPAIIGHFGLRFVDEGTRYPYHDEGSFTFAEFVTRYMNFTWNEDLAEGTALAHSADLTRALAKLQHALQASPDSVAGWRTMSLVLRRMSRVSEARAAAERAIALDPADPDSRAELARVLLVDRDLQEAENQARQAIAMFPADGSSHLVLAKVLSTAGRLDEAAHAARRAVALRPGDPDGRALLGDIVSHQHPSPGNQVVPHSSVRILFLQTSDNTYRPLLELTSQTVREYCSRHECSYESFLGIVRGFHPWHAAYNRIPMLKRLLDTSYSGWVCYLDADAYVADLDFDLKGYLSDKGDFALIIAPGEPSCPWWNVNDGVFLINLAHPVAKAIVRDWSRRFEAIADDELRSAKAWFQIPSDQRLLWDALQGVPGAERHTLVQRDRPNVLNYSDGLFIRQVLRVVGNLEVRAAQLKERVEQVLGTGQEMPRSVFAVGNAKMQELFVRTLYRVLLLREPDPSGLSNSVRKMQAGANFEDLMRSCLECSEFAAKHQRFAETYLRQEVSSN